ncbi:hypothetical protein [Glutamicibacter sp. JC586]|uniref:hypothetical protein n=1 Tax=Glutamicibacter sp. JC586 TaxID=2590552 RepID=UPI001359CFA0|nr:hypothetical protein [Glutamicibacter sp. JC586]
MRRLGVVNLLLGIPGIIYYWMLCVVVMGNPISSWGRSVRDLLEESSIFPLQMILGPPLAIGTIIWVIANVNLIYRRKRAGACQKTSSKITHWVIALGASLVPSLIFLGVASFF